MPSGRLSFSGEMRRRRDLVADRFANLQEQLDRVTIDLGAAEEELQAWDRLLPLVIKGEVFDQAAYGLSPVELVGNDGEGNGRGKYHIAEISDVPKSKLSLHEALQLLIDDLLPKRPEGITINEIYLEAASVMGLTNDAHLHQRIGASISTLVKAQRISYRDRRVYERGK